MLNLESPCEAAHETPVKRKGGEVEPHTAESEQPCARSLEELEACDLFEKFDQLVRVSVEEEAFSDDFEDEVARRLDYDRPRAIRLSFDPTTSSMKKKPRAALPRPFAAINLFQVPQKPAEEAPLGEGPWGSPERVERHSEAWVMLAARKEREEE